MSLLKIAVEKLPPSQRSSLEIFVREEAFQLRSATVTFSYILFFVFHICLSICQRQHMPKICIVLSCRSTFKCSFLTSFVFWFVFLNASSHLFLIFFNCFKFAVYTLSTSWLYYNTIQYNITWLFLSRN